MQIKRIWRLRSCENTKIGNYENMKIGLRKFENRKQENKKKIRKETRKYWKQENI